MNLTVMATMSFPRLAVSEMLSFEELAKLFLPLDKRALRNP